MNQQMDERTNGWMNEVQGTINIFIMKLNSAKIIDKCKKKKEKKNQKLFDIYRAIDLHRIRNAVE